MSNTRNRIRLAVDLANPFAPPINQSTSESPQFAAFRTCRVDVGVYDNALFQPTIAQFASLTFELMLNSDRTGSRIVSKTVSAAAFQSAAVSGWASATQQHAVFQITEAEMSAFSFAGGVHEVDLWLAITGSSADGNVTLLAGQCKAIRDGGVFTGASAPAAGDPQ